MGLESLYLTENQELSYRLRTRIARVFGLLGRDPYAAKNIANDAYNVRSAFVHGNRVKKDDSKTIIKRYGNFEALLNAVLDQLRIAIVALRLSGLDKEEFIKLIDNSFIDQRVLPKLEEILLPIKTLLTSNAE